jgi:hypothetical protein
VLLLLLLLLLLPQSRVSLSHCSLLLPLLVLRLM